MSPERMDEAFERWRRDGRTFQHGPHAIFFREAGQGPTLLAIHGFPSASWDWHPLWPELTARFRVIAADMIGFGWSAKPRRYAYSMMDQATLHERLLAERGVERVHILAHDYGDTVAQELLARFAERKRQGTTGLIIETACLLNGGIFPEAHRPRPVQRLMATPLGPLVGRLMSKRAFGSSLVAIFGPATPPSAQLIDELWALLTHEQGPLVVHQLLGYMAERREHRERWVGALSVAGVPLRMINGVADPVSGAHLVARFRELMPGADVVELPSIGHYPQVEDPAGVLRAFLAFHGELHSVRDRV
jgi:pimeloyl-ACP methyl ester carboxylesterase